MTDNRTLGEIKADDIANLEYIIHKECKERLFRNGTKAAEFVGQCLFARLRKLGVKVDERVDERFVDRMLRKCNIKVENRRYDEEEDKWREGIYVYKDNEIVGFISQPKPIKSKWLFFLTPKVSVMTNIDPERP